MARRRHEARLAAVGALGLLLGEAVRLERLAQLVGALSDALFESLLGIEQGLLRALEVRDIGIGRDEAATGHRLPVNPVDSAVAAQALERVGSAGAQVRQTLL